jgi:hypothetical protein
VNCEICRTDIPAHPCDTCYPVTLWAVKSSGTVRMEFTDLAAACSSRDALESLQRRPFTSYVVTVAERGTSPEAEAWLKRRMRAADEANARTWARYAYNGRCEFCDTRGHSGGDCPTYGPEVRHA